MKKKQLFPAAGAAAADATQTIRLAISASTLLFSPSLFANVEFRTNQSCDKEKQLEYLHSRVPVLALL